MEEPRLDATLTWKTPVLLSFGIGLLILVSTGSMAQELGGASFWIWVAAALMGSVQCILIYYFAKKYPRKSGGTATYAHEGIRTLSRFWGGVSMWGYWLAWTPGIIINCLLAVDYLRAAFDIHINDIALTSAALIVLYVIHYFGHRINIKVTTTFSLIAIAPFIALAIGLLFQPLKFFSPNIFDFHSFTFPLFIKWFFVAAWTAYGAEMSSNLFAELKQPDQDRSKSIIGANVVCVCLMTALPLLLLITGGPIALAQDPTVSLLPASLNIFGAWGLKIISLAIAASLLLGAQAFIIGSSRTLYQMSMDGILPESFRGLNRYGTPYRNIVWDLAVIFLLLAIFKQNIISIVAVSNVGYIMVFVLLGFSALIFGKNLSNNPTEQKFIRGVGLFVFLINLFLISFGSWLWGMEVFVIGFGILITFLPLFWWRKTHHELPIG